MSNFLRTLYLSGICLRFRGLQSLFNTNVSFSFKLLFIKKFLSCPNSLCFFCYSRAKSMSLHLSQSNIPNVHCRLQLFVARLVSPRPKGL